jgi:hypothetical protein
MEENTTALAVNESQNARRLEAALRLACLTDRELIELANARGYDVEYADAVNEED